MNLSADVDGSKHYEKNQVQSDDEDTSGSCTEHVGDVVNDVEFKHKSYQISATPEKLKPYIPTQITCILTRGYRQQISQTATLASVP